MRALYRWLQEQPMFDDILIWVLVFVDAAVLAIHIAWGLPT